MEMADVRDAFSQKQDSILAAASKVFREVGYKQATIGEISQAAEVSRTTFYHYFTNKSKLVELFLTKQEDYALGSLKYLHDESISITVKLNWMLELKHKSISEWGSVFIKDLMQDNNFRNRIHQIQSKMAEEFIKFLRIEQKKGNINKAYEPEFIFALMTKLEYLMMDKDIQEFYPDLADLIVTLLNITLDGVRTR
jgi:AcrR family transcriptional regulator